MSAVTRGSAWRRRAVGYGVGAMVVAASVAHVQHPGAFWALWTRLTYSHAGRLVDASQYEDAARWITAVDGPTSAAHAAVSAGAIDSGSARLVEMAKATSSNIVVMDRESQVLVESYHARPGADARMLTQSMSMAKSLVGLLTGVAVAKGVIRSVDQPLSELLAEFRGDQRGAITVKQLLQMESGLAHQDAGFPLSSLQAMYFGDHPHSWALSVKAVRPPGTAFQYNSVNTQLLLIVLERRLGAEFESLLAEHIWRPLKLEPAFAWRSSASGEAKGFCCVFATPRTWASLGRVFLDTVDGQFRTAAFVPMSWLHEMQRPSTLGQRYGYQVWLGRTEDKLVRYTYFEGSPHQYAMAFPSLGLVAVRVGDEDPDFDPVALVREVVAFAASRDR